MRTVWRVWNGGLPLLAVDAGMRMWMRPDTLKEELGWAAGGAALMEWHMHQRVVARVYGTGSGDVPWLGGCWECCSMVSTDARCTEAVEASISGQVLPGMNVQLLVAVAAQACFVIVHAPVAAAWFSWADGCAQTQEVQVLTQWH